MWPFSKRTDDDDDDDRPEAPWQNVSQDEIPVTRVASDASGDYLETPDGTLINTRPFDNEGDD
jgi:hypothetical protein